MIVANQEGICASVPSRTVADFDHALGAEAEERMEGHMARELHLLTVSLVFVFLGAIVFGVIH